MVQCHAGGFAKLLFPGGDPKLTPLDRRFCGFYASLESQMAAGCTTEIDEAYYRDFTTYFVAALTGRDRLGRPSTGADYDKDGRVGMNEGVPAGPWSTTTPSTPPSAPPTSSYAPS